jgi:hypothetical protein
MEKDPLQKKIEILSWFILAVLLVFSGVFLSYRFSLGVLCGGLISILNFRMLYRSLSGFFRSLAEGEKSSLLWNHHIRLAVTGVVLYFLISKAIADVIGLLAGLSVVVMSIMITVPIMLAKKSYIEEVR